MNTYEFNTNVDVDEDKYNIADESNFKTFDQYINAIIEITAETNSESIESIGNLESICSSTASTFTNTTETKLSIAELLSEDSVSVSSDFSINSMEIDDLSEFVLTIIDTYPFKSNQMFCEKNESDDLINYVLNEVLINCDIPSHLVPDDFPEFIFQTIPQYKFIYDLDDENKDINNNVNKYENCINLKTPLITKTKQQIDERMTDLRSRPQPAQRTPAWYRFRMNLLSASNYYKVMGSQAAKNSIINEKCSQYNTPPIVVDSNAPSKSINVETPMHWGQKYEPMSVLLYEHKYDTKVEEFGCIQHENHYFIGASPDGINCCPNSPLYGRMIEIKNVVSRIITGEPKKEYFAQMQVQMEVCDLNECDFLETKFVEYDNYTAFINDSCDDNVFMSNDDLPPNLPLNTTFNNNLQTQKKRKGSIVYFTQPNGVPYYIYMPISIKTLNSFNLWIEKTINLYTSEKYNYSFITICYWKLEVFNIVLVLRDPNWFASTLNNAASIWKIIETERLCDYSHRAPKKRVPVIKSCSSSIDEPSNDSNYLFKLFNCKNNI